MSSTTGRSTRPSNAGRPKGPKKGVQRRKEPFQKAPTPVFQARSTIADPKIARPRPRKVATCPNKDCPKPEIIDDDGSKVCVTCGTVAQESNIVAEITFGESSTGAAVVQGTYVGADRSHGRGGPGPGGHPTDESPTRAQTQQLAKLIIDKLITEMRLPGNLKEVALKTFSHAHRSFVQGRSIRAVAAVALYVTCRRYQKDLIETSVMLIDIAEHQNFNVYMLGSIYTKMVRTLGYQWQIEPINPENLIWRFAQSLEFGSRATVYKIVTEATRIVQRMNRDWMTTGRRPAGICGAALVIAARMNNFRRTVREIVYVVKVTEITINKRLEEFKYTDSSKLTVDEFRTTDLEKEHDPPAFTRAREGPKPKGKRGRKRKHPETAAEIEGDEAEDGGEAIPNPEQSRRFDKDGFAIPSIPIDPALRARGEEAIDEALTTAVTSALSEMRQDSSAQPENDPSSRSEPIDQSDTASIASTDTSATGSTTISETTGLPRKGKRGRPKGSKNKGPAPLSSAEIALEAAIEQEVRSGLTQIELNADLVTQAAEASKARTRKQQERQRAKASKTQPSEPASAPEPSTTQPHDPASPSTPAEVTPHPISMSTTIDPNEFEDDPEVANCLLTPAEREIKEIMWVQENNSWLREQHRKRVAAELKAADPNQQPTPGRGGRRKKKRARLGAPTYLNQNKDDGQADDNLEGDENTQAAGEDEEAGAETEPTQIDADGNIIALSREETERRVQRAVQGLLGHRGYSRRLNYNVIGTLFPGSTERRSSIESRGSLYEKGKKARRASQERREGSSASAPSVSSASTSTSAAAPATTGSRPTPPSAPQQQISQRLDTASSSPLSSLPHSPPAATALETPTATTAAAAIAGQGEEGEEDSEDDVDLMGDMEDDLEDEGEAGIDDEVEVALAGQWKRNDEDEGDEEDEI